MQFMRHFQRRTETLSSSLLSSIERPEINDMTESVVEQASLEWLSALGYGIAYGPEIGCGQPGAERADWAQVVLEGRLRQALQRLNPDVPATALEEAFRKLTRPDSPSPGAGHQAMPWPIVHGV